MVQMYDVVLNGAGYMLVPPPDRPNAALGSYKLNVTPFKPAHARTGIREWTMPLSGKDGSRWRADAMVNEPGGYGTVPGMMLGPAFRATALNVIQITCGVQFQGAVYFGIGAGLYRMTLDGALHVLGVANIGGALAGNITGLWVENNRLWIAMASPATSFASTDGVTVTTAPGTVVATQGFTFAQGNWVQSRASATTIGGTIDGGTTWNYYQTEAAIRAICPTGRSVLIGHLAGIDELTGSFGGSTTFSGGLTPLVRTTGAGTFSDLIWMVDFQGNVYAWFDGTVCLLQRSTVYYGRLAPVPGAPRGNGQAAVVAAGRLWVSLTTTSGYEVWSFDGLRWVRNLAPGGGVNPSVLVSCAGVATDADVLGLPTGGGVVYGFLTSSLTHTAYPAASGSVTCGLWDADTPDAIKTWTEIEVVWNLPDRAVGTPTGTLKIETSTNGTDFTVAGTASIAASNGGTIRQALSGVNAETLTVRVTWTPSANGTAFRIVAVYANGWELPATPPVKRWQIKVRCTDKLVRRDSTVDSRTGEQMRAALIALANTGSAVSFQDLDYDANAVNQTVRVVAIEETSCKGDGTHFWESEMTLTVEAIA